MADNVAITPGTGATVAADDVGGVLFQRVKATWGPDGTANDADVATGKPLPIQVRSATGLIPVGEPTDAKSTATDTTSASLISIMKQVSASLQALARIEDAVHASGETGVMALAVRRDTASAGAADGDYVALSTDASGNLRIVIPDSQLDGSEYETVAASQTAQVLGPTGATGDFISKVVIVPATTSPGNVLLLDNATSITIFTGGASSVSNLVPFTVDLGMTSVSGAWKLTTGANVSCIGIGNFT